MKKDIHPTYYPQATISCACGSTITVGSTREAMEVEICSACHPFYTGKEKLVDAAGRVERFEQRRKAGKAAEERRTRTVKTVSAAPRRKHKTPAKKKDSV